MIKKIPIQLNKVKYIDDKNDNFVLKKFKEKFEAVIIIIKIKFKVIKKYLAKTLILTVIM